jgi:hypothetical protein
MSFSDEAATKKNMAWGGSIFAALFISIVSGGVFGLLEMKDAITQIKTELAYRGKSAEKQAEVLERVSGKINSIDSKVLRIEEQIGSVKDRVDRMDGANRKQ